MMKARVIESALLATALIFPVVAQAQDVSGTLSDGVAENDIQVLKENTKEIEHVAEENAALAEGAEKSAKAEKTAEESAKTVDEAGKVAEDNASDDVAKVADEAGKVAEDKASDDDAKVADDAVKTTDDAGKAAEVEEKSADEAGKVAEEKASDDVAKVADEAGKVAEVEEKSADEAVKVAEVEEKSAGEAVKVVEENLVDDAVKVADKGEDKASKDGEKSSKDDKDDDDKSWGVNAAIGFDLGLGAFTKDEYARKVRSRFTMTLGGYYTIPVIDTDIHLETGFSQWMSKAGGSNGKYEFRWSDTTIGLSREIWSYKSGEFSVAFNADLSFVLPTSKASINANLYTSIVPSLAASIKLWRFSLAYGITYSYNAHKYTSVTLDPDDIDVLSRSTGNEIIDSHNIAIGGVLAEHDLANQFVLGIECIRKVLDLSIGFAFADSWSYDNGTITSDDEFVGKHAKVGRGHSQYSQGSLVLSYKPIKYATVSFGMVSTQPWKTADNKTLRFPWFDTESPSKNYTKFMLSATFQY